MVDEQTIKRVARTCRIKITDKEIPKFKSEFEEVLNMFSILQEIDVSDIEDKDVSVLPISVNKEMRKDKAVDKGLKKDCLEIAKHKKDDYFTGPKAF